jgi:hypothetical protein
LVGAGVHRLETGTIDGQAQSWRWTSGSRPFYVPVPEPGPGGPVVIDGEVHPDVDLVSVINHAGSFLCGDGHAGEFGLGAPDDGRFDAPAERFGFSATAPVFRADTLRRVGNFATPFFAYCEDTDWCLRARLAGMRIIYDHRATVYHRLSATSGGLREKRVVHLALRNSLLCLARNAPATVAYHFITKSFREGSDDVNRAVAARLPWALTTRLSRPWTWQRARASVWSRWADRGMEWDISPAREVSRLRKERPD